MLENYFNVLLEILPYLCTRPCTVEFKDKRVSRGGGDTFLPKKELKCFCDKGTKRTYGNKSVSENSSGSVYFVGDVVPELEKILGGTIWINDVAYDFEGGQKMEVDGKVYYTLLTLI